MEQARFTEAFSAEPVVIFVDLDCSECESCLRQIIQTGSSIPYVVPVDIEQDSTKANAATLLELIQMTEGLTYYSLEMFTAAGTQTAMDFYLQNPSVLGLSVDAIHSLDEAHRRVMSNAEVARRMGIAAVPVVYIEGLRYGGDCAKTLERLAESIR